MSTPFWVRPYGRDARWSSTELAEGPYEVPTRSEAIRLADELTATHGKTWVAILVRGGHLSQIVHRGREGTPAPTIGDCPACGDGADESEPGVWDCGSCGFQFDLSRPEMCLRCELNRDLHIGDRHWLTLGIDRDGEPIAATGEERDR